MNLLAHSRCPGKLILSGEHATVYGKNAVAITVDLYTEVKVFNSEDQFITLVLENFNFERKWPLRDLQKVSSILCNGKFTYSEECVKIVQHLLDDQSLSGQGSLFNSCLAFLLLYLSIGDASVYAERKSIRVEVSSKMPNGAGLGSSSSYIVSLARVLFTAYNVTTTKADLNQWCYEVDKIFHGRPSGIDNSICTYGGAILFGSGQVIEKIDSHDLRDLAHIPVILVNTKVPRNTKTMVERCRTRLDTFPEVGPSILESIANISMTLWKSMKDKNLEAMPVLFDMNQNLLNCLNVGHEKIDQIVNISKKYGLSAKLTGAGGGGIVIVYLSDKSHLEKSVIEELQSEGFSCYQVKLGVPGVQIL